MTKPMNRAISSRRRGGAQQVGTSLQRGGDPHLRHRVCNEHAAATRRRLDPLALVVHQIARLHHRAQLRPCLILEDRPVQDDEHQVEDARSLVGRGRSATPQQFWTIHKRIANLARREPPIKVTRDDLGKRWFLRHG